MAQRLFSILCVCGLMVMSTAAFAGEGEVPAGNHAVQPAATPPALLYVLAPETAYLEGCFPPCLCPIQMADSVAGTFSLTPNPPTETDLRSWQVGDVDWLVVLGDEEVPITGSGMYLQTQVGDESYHRLVLTVQIGGADPAILDSGLVPGGSGGGHPSIHIAVDENGLVCLDTLIQVHATPVLLSRLELE